MLGIGTGGNPEARVTYLLANASRLSAEDRISTQQPGKEAIVAALFADAGGVKVSQDDH